MKITIGLNAKVLPLVAVIAWFMQIVDPSQVLHGFLLRDLPPPYSWDGSPKNEIHWPQ